MTPSWLVQLSPSVVSALQWMLVGIEVLMLAGVAAWAVHQRRARRLAGSRDGSGTPAELAVPDAEPARAMRTGSDGPRDRRVMGLRVLGGAGRHAGERRAASAHGEPHVPRSVSPAAPRPAAPRPGARTPGAVPATAIHCPCCGTTVAADAAHGLVVTRCPGCERRVSARMDGGRLVVTVDEA